MSEVNTINNFEVVAKKELSQAEHTLQAAKEYKITNQFDAEAGNMMLKEIKARAKEIENTRTSFVKPLNDHVKMINDWFKKPLGVLEEAEKTLKNCIMAYDNEVRRKLAEEEARLRAEAAEKERKERERLSKQAAKAEEKGKAEKAEELRSQAESVSIQAPVLAPAKSTMAYRTDFDFEVINKALIPEKYKLVDEVTIRRIVKAEKDLCDIPGIRVISKQVPISR